MDIWFTRNGHGSGFFDHNYENEKITALLGRICRVDRNAPFSEWCGINMPNPRQDLESLKVLQKQIFEMAKESHPS
jgi:hypothetical protein